MFEISDLKEKKLPDLQEIAQSLGMKKFKTLKKEELIYRIIDFQAENPATILSEKETKPSEEGEKKVKPAKAAPKAKENQDNRDKKEKAPNTTKSQEARPKKEKNKKEAQPKENSTVLENKDAAAQAARKQPENTNKENKGKFSQHANKDKKANNFPKQERKEADTAIPAVKKTEPTPAAKPVSTETVPPTTAPNPLPQPNAAPSNHNNTPKVNNNENFDKEKKNRYRSPDFEFDGIVECEGVFELLGNRTSA